MAVQYDMQSEASDTVDYLEKLAETLEGWARESHQYGWSTHQVDANLREANERRRRAYRLRRSVTARPLY